MSIPKSSIVAVSIALGATFPARAGFGTLNAVTAETGVITLEERSRAYSSIEGVTEDWPANSEIVALANAYFGQQPKPTSFVVSVRDDTTETISEALTAIEQRGVPWYGLIFTKEIREGVQINGEDAVEAAAEWIQARTKVFFNTTNDPDTLDGLSTTDIAYVLNNRNFNRTMTTYSSEVDEYPSASIAGRAFTVDFSQPNSTLTLKFKSLPGITTEDISSNDKAILDSKRANVFFQVADTAIYGESYMAGDYFFDEIHGVDWLTDAIQTEVYGYLVSRTTKVPYTDKGVAALQQQVTKVLDTAVLNGLIAPGETIDGIFLGSGYQITTVPVADVSASEKQNRQYNGLSFVALGAGAIHGVQIQGTFER